MKIHLSTLQFVLSTILLFASPAKAEERVTVQWWHAMRGKLEGIVNEMVDTYNKSQTKYRVVPVLKGNYTETLNSAVAAYRGRRQPHIIQVFEVGTMTMLDSGVIYPVQDLMKDMKIDIDWSQFIQPVLSYYRNADGELMSMPFNSSTPILYYNKKMLEQAKVTKIPRTWEEMHLANKAIVASGGPCGLVNGWQSWVLLENFSAIHNTPFSSMDNGFSGLSKNLEFNNDLVVKNIETLRKGLANGTYSYEGRESPPARTAFLNQKCAFYMDSSANYSSLKAVAKFDWGAAPLPHYQKVSAKNSIIGGATLWVFKGHKEKEYRAIADFLKFVGGPSNQAWWHQKTGYLPISKVAYENLKAQGYYQEDPRQEVAILQMLQSEPTKHSSGIRLGNFTQIREVVNEELEKIWSGRVSTKEGLDNAVRRGNRLLEKFARIASRKNK